MQNQETNINAETSEASQTTDSSTGGSSGSSTGDSTTSVESVQPAELDDVREIQNVELEEISLMKDGSVEVGFTEKKICPKCGQIMPPKSKQSGKGYYKRTPKTIWSKVEAAKILDVKFRKQIFKFYYWLMFSKREQKMNAAKEFFSAEFPTRTPIAVYQKAWRIKKRIGVKKLKS